jgi:hypothetical protein
LSLDKVMRFLSMMSVATKKAIAVVGDRFFGG